MNAPKSYIFLGFVLFSLAGCQPKPETAESIPTPPEPHLTEVKKAPEPQVEPLPSKVPALFEGMIIGENVRMRSDSDGLTGCDMDLYPVLLQKDSNDMLFFFNQNEAFESLGYHVYEDDLGRIYFTYESEGAARLLRMCI